MRSGVIAAAVLWCGSGFAQNPETVIRSSVREVLLDVVVRDAHGRLVTNLQPKDFTIYEDGVRQQVRSFRLVAGSEVRAEDQKQAAESEKAAVNAPVPQPAVNPLRTVNVVCLILSDLSAETRAFAFESARKFVNSELRPNTFIGVFSLDGTGLRPMFPFSNNREHLLKAVELAAVNQLPATSLGTAAMLNGLGIGPIGNISSSGLGSDGSADGSSPAHPLGTRGEIGFSVNAGLREIDVLKALVRDLSPLPFQKTVLLLSTGLTRPPDLLEYWDSLIQGANRASVTFYALDVNGLCNADCDSPMATSSEMLQAAAALSRGQARSGQKRLPTTPSGPSSSSTAQLMEMAHEDDFVKFTVSSANRQEALRELAERTGGFLIANTNNADKLISRVMEEVDTHYEIAYPPASERYDGHFRKVEVKLTQPRLRVETRSGYFAVPDAGAGLTPEEMAGLRALDRQPRPHAFDFLLHTYRFRDTGGTAQYAIAFEMPISNLTATPSISKDKHSLHASLLALVKNADGNIVERLSKDIPSEVADDHLAAVQVELMTYEHAVRLPAGHYTVEGVVVDHEGNRASTKAVAIDNPEQRGIGLSDISLVRKLENISRPADSTNPFEYTGKRVLPFVSTDLFAGARPFLYFVVYPESGNPAKPEMRIRLLKNGRVISQRKSELFADPTGQAPIVIAASAKPGSYEVKVTVTQGRNSAERTLAYTLAGK